MPIEWRQIQETIWNCSACCSNPRVEENIRQQTDIPISRTELLVVAVAPPYIADIERKIIARSVTNNSQDRLRSFIEDSLESRWEEILPRGLTVLHAVKCAIIPNEMGFQNPDSRIVDTCAPRHLALEFDKLKPLVVIALGTAARRAVLKILGREKPCAIRLSGMAQGEHDIRYKGSTFKLIVTKFPRGAGKLQARIDLRKAAELAGILREEKTSL